MLKIAGFIAIIMSFLGGYLLAKSELSGLWNPFEIALEGTAATESADNKDLDVKGAKAATKNSSELQAKTAEDNKTIESSSEKNELDVKFYEQLEKQVERDRFNSLAAQIQQQLYRDGSLKPYSDQVLFSVTDNGLQIQLSDKKARPMFDSSSDIIMPHTQKLLTKLAQSLTQLPNKVLISGHTDALAYANQTGYSNWERSSKRANATRRALQSAGLPIRQVAQVVAYGSSDLLNADNPLSPINRRVSILVLSKQSQERLNAFSSWPNRAKQQRQAANNTKNDNRHKALGKTQTQAPSTVKPDDTVSVQSFRRQQVLRSQQEAINANSRSLITAPLSHNVPQAKQAVSERAASSNNIAQPKAKLETRSSGKNPTMSTSSVESKSSATQTSSPAWWEN